MIRRDFIFIGLAAALDAALASPALAQSSKTIPAPGITSVEIRIPGTLTVVQGNQENLLLSGDPEMISRITTSMSGGDLIIDSESAMFSRGARLDGKLTVKSLQKLLIDGTADVRLGPMSTSRLQVTISGSSHVDLGALHTEALDVKISGHGDVAGGGSATGVVVQISGAGNAKLAALQAEIAKVSISGKGDVELGVSKRLDAHITGYGDVKYLGDPKITQSISGLGSVSKLGG
jgi:hypothetical protein